MGQALAREWGDLVVNPVLLSLFGHVTLDWSPSFLCLGQRAGQGDPNSAVPSSPEPCDLSPDLFTGLTCFFGTGD